MIKTYSELSRIDNFRDRFAYLRLGGAVGAETFGFDRYLNQEFYRSVLWKRARTHVIARDYGCDLGFDGHEIFDKVYVHHMNPMSPDDIKHSNVDILDPEYLITVCHLTHNAIHYGDESLLPKPVIARRPGDTKLW
jgi:hypothetical protein